MQINLKAARINKNLTQEEAAKQLGISKYTLSNYERGKSFPDVSVIKTIEKVYEVEYDNIIFFTQ
jgi:transcriptional regulator with XRE-family HTH domain